MGGAAQATMEYFHSHRLVALPVSTDGRARARATSTNTGDEDKTGKRLNFDPKLVRNQ